MTAALPNSLAALGRSLPPRRDQPLAAAPPKVKPPEKTALVNDLSSGLGRYLRPQAAYRWLLPSLAAITPQYIESTLRGALAGNHVQAWELFDLMLDTWPELASCQAELVEGVQVRKLVFEPYHEEDEEPSDDAQRKCRVVSAALRRMQPDACADENDLDGTIKDILAGWFMGQVVLEVNWDSAYNSEEINLINAGALGDITAPRSAFWVHPVCYAWNMEGRLGLRQEISNNYRAVTKERGAQGTARPTSGPTSSAWSFSTFQPRPTDIIEFPPEKFLVGIHKSKSGTALGGPLLRPLAWWWCAANFSADWLLNLAQLFGIPFRWVQYDPSLPDPLKQELDTMMQNMGSSGWARFPSGTSMEFLEAGKGADNSPQDALLDRCDRYARLLILGQTMSGSQDASKGGGKAFGEVETGVKGKRIDAACKYVAGVLNMQLAASIVRVNFNDAAEIPTARFLDDQEGSLEDAQRDAQLAGAGLKIGVNFLRKKYGIPAPDDEEETIGGADSTPLPSGGAQGTAGPTNEAETEPQRHGDTEVEAKASDIAQALAEDAAHVVDRLRSIAEINDPQIFEARLQQFLADFPALAQDIQKDSATSRALMPVIKRAFINGVKKS